jgi:tetratricopeptide (TPR) repeat protein
MSTAIRRYCTAVPILIALAALVSCNRDPNVAKRRYLESGNRYFEKGKYKEAAIMYKDALQKDALWAPAHYKLALTYLKLGQVGGAVPEFRKAIERPPIDTPEHWDSVVNLCDIFLTAQTDPRNQPLLKDVETYIKQLLAHDAKSFDGHRLNGDFLFVQARYAVQSARKDEAEALLKQAGEEYQKADEAKPAQSGVLMQMGRLAEVRNDKAGAEALFRRVIAKDKSYRPAYTELYRLEMMQGKKDEGEATLKLAFQNNPKVYDFLVLLAEQYSIEQRTADMERVLQEIKGHAADYPNAYFAVAAFYLRLGNADGAIREYREGMAKDPKRKLAYEKYIIEVLMRQGKRSEAADLNAQILKSNPDDSDAKGLEASLLLDKGNVDQALSELQAVVTAAPTNPVAHFNLGRAYLAGRQFEQARQQFERAIEIRPDYLRARYALAQLQLLRGEFEAAQKTAEAMLATDKNDVAARLIQSASLLGLKKYEDARKLLTALQSALPNSPDVFFQLALVDMAETKYKDAETNFRRVYQLNPSNVRGLAGVAETFMVRNDADGALNVFQAEIAKAPARADLKLAAGNIALRAGRFDQAIALYQGAIPNIDAKLTKDRSNAYVMIGEAYRRKGDLANAIDAFKKAREATPDNTAALDNLAVVLDAASRWDEARSVYEAARKLQPNNVISLNNEAFLIAEHGGDLEQALTMAQRATQIAPKVPEVRDTLGWIYLKKGLPAEAADVFKGVVADQPANATYRYHLGIAYMQKGDKPNARKELQDSLKYNPSVTEKQKIEQALAQVK